MNSLVRLLLCLPVWATMTLPTSGQPARSDVSTFPPVIAGALVETYKAVDGAELRLWIFEPPADAATVAPRPVIVFFFGGGWTNGSPAQFAPQCRYFAARGMVTITADYRVASRHGVNVADCVEDAKSCLRWVRRHAARLGIDPDRVVAGGGSAGGHLAAATAILSGFNTAGEDTSVSERPNALVLFNPALATAAYPGVESSGFETRLTAERLGCEPETISPLHHVRPGLPPTLILHGEADTTVPFVIVRAFAAATQAAGNHCELIGYAGQPHGFFNAKKYDDTVAEADRFLVSLGYLPPAQP